ncbi:MAG: C45 family autoproteolytic acyltransferase/hydrolase [Candidatus Latescibacteria bacterium]|nr:C45 family autoproteolytic acyltransferase/hydrolase [Candidatus Latescibacterota bacterium]
MHYLRSGGTARERGVAHGEAARDGIARLIATYREGYKVEGGGWRDGLDPIGRRKRAKDRTAEIRDLCPSGCDEIEGIAEGAGLPIEDLYELNLGFEIGLPPGGSACSIYGFRTGEGRVWLGKSDDVPEVELGYNAVNHTSPVDGFRSVQMHFVGTIWTTSAVNETGFCLGMTGLSGAVTNDGGIPTLFLLHAMAERCETVAEAEAMCAAHTISRNGMSILMGDAKGDVAILEVHVDGQEIRRPGSAGEAIWQTNHCVGPALQGRDDPASDLMENSRERTNRLAALDPHVERSFEGLTDLYRTHDDPTGICQHGAGGLHTDSAIVMSPDEQVMWATEGYPCSNPFIAHALE